MKAELSRLIPRKPSANLELLMINSERFLSGAGLRETLRIVNNMRCL